MSVSEHLTGLPYLGGKSFQGTGSGPWIADQLPYDDGYIEPFAGMLGVLLQRRPSKSEIINDVNSRVSNWWKVVRDYPHELAERIYNSPVSRDDFDEAMQNVDTHEDPIERARMLTTIIWSTHSHRPNPGGKGSFVVDWGYNRNKQILPPRIIRLADRLREVQIENIDACVILERCRPKTNVVIYCDPPYSDTATYDDTYGLDRDLMADLLTQQKGKVAVSGYGTEWDLLGWRRTERISDVSIGVYKKSEKHHEQVKEWDTQRQEVLWMNYDATEIGGLF